MYFVVAFRGSNCCTTCRLQMRVSAPNHLAIALRCVRPQWRCFSFRRGLKNGGKCLTCAVLSRVIGCDVAVCSAVVCCHMRILDGVPMSHARLCGARSTIFHHAVATADALGSSLRVSGGCISCLLRVGVSAACCGWVYQLPVAGGCIS